MAATIYRDEIVEIRTRYTLSLTEKYMEQLNYWLSSLCAGTLTQLITEEEVIFALDGSYDKYMNTIFKWIDNHGDLYEAKLGDVVKDALIADIWQEGIVEERPEVVHVEMEGVFENVERC